MPDKINIHATLEHILKEKIRALELAIEDAIKSRDLETKSSAGDKYETGREMMQKEIDNYEKQLAGAQRQLHECGNIHSDRISHEIAAGSLVTTNEGMYYFATGYGKIEVAGEGVMVVSLGSPLGKALMDKSKGEQVEFLNRSIQILEIQ